MNISQGRPADGSKRPERERQIYDFLDADDILYERIEHEPLFSMADYQEVEKSFCGGKVFKNLFLCNRQQTKFYLLLMPGDKPFKTKEISNQIHSARLSFGSEEKMKELLGVTTGSLSPLCLLFDCDRQVEFLVDEDVLKEEYALIHSAVNTTTLRIKVECLLSAIQDKTGHPYQAVVLKGE